MTKGINVPVTAKDEFSPTLDRFSDKARNVFRQAGTSMERHLPGASARSEFALRSLEQQFGRTGTAALNFGRKLGSSFGGIEGALGAVGIGGLGATALVGTFTNELRQSFQDLDALAKMSRRLGGDPAGLQKLQYAFGQAGVEAGTLNKALQTLRKNAGEAATGNKALDAAFLELGIDARRFSRLGIEQQMVELADAMQRADGDGARLRLTMKVLGEEGAALKDQLSQGGRALDEALKRREAMPGLFTDRDLEKIEAANDAIDDVKVTLKGMVDLIAVDAAPTVDFLARNFFRLRQEAERTGEAVANIFTGEGGFKDVRQIAKQGAINAIPGMGILLTGDKEKPKPLAAAAPLAPAPMTDAQLFQRKLSDAFLTRALGAASGARDTFDSLGKKLDYAAWRGKALAESTGKAFEDAFATAKARIDAKARDDDAALRLREREAERLFLETRTDAELRRMEESRAGALLASGDITREVFDRAMKGIAERFAPKVAEEKERIARDGGVLSSTVSRTLVRGTGATPLEQLARNSAEEIKINREMRALLLRVAVGTERIFGKPGPKVVGE